MSPDDLLTATEAGKILRVCKATVIRRIKAGKLKGFRESGGRSPYLVRRSSVDEYIKTLESKEQ